MGTFTKGQIILYPFPYTDLSGQKLRPCLVLSNEMRDDILLCQITSQRILADEFSIKLGINETENGTLSIDSLIRCNMLFTADKSYAKSIICNLTSKKYEEVCKKIHKIIN
jgi:mRNA interferase MazF